MIPMSYRTPKEIADKARDLMDEAGDTHAEVSDLLGVDRSSVSYALTDPSSRRIKLLGQILGLYGWKVDTDTPAYDVSGPEDG